MTDVSPLRPLSALTRSPIGGAQALTTTMSFEEALRSADNGTNRMFGFDELGMFGRRSPTTPSARIVPSKAQAPTAPDGLFETGTGSPVATGRMQAEVWKYAPSASAVVAPRPVPLSQLFFHGTPAAEVAIAAEVGCLPIATGEMSPGETSELLRGRPLPVGTPSRPANLDRTRLALAIDSGQARLVVRDFSLTEEDRALLEERTAALLANHGLAQAELTLNGSAEARPVDRKEA